MKENRRKMAGRRNRDSFSRLLTYIAGRLYIVSLLLGALVLVVLLALHRYHPEPGVWNRLRQAAGARLVDDVYIGKRGYLIEAAGSFDSVDMQEKAGYIRSFAEQSSGIKVAVMLVPDKAGVLTNRLPAFVSGPDQQQVFSLVKERLGDKVQWVELYPTLRSHRMEEIYFHTDSRWTALGAFYGAQAAAGTMGLPDDLSSRFAAFDVTEDFRGNLSARTGLRIRGERLEAYSPKEVDKSVIVTAPYDGVRRTDLYDMAALTTKDPYQIFPGAGQSLTDIRTMTANGRRLLVVQDTFGSALVPFLIPYFEEIIIVRPSLYWEKAKDLAGEYGVTDCLFIYSGNELAGARSLGAFLGGDAGE